MPLITLKKRAEFLRLRGGVRWATPSFALETKPRDGTAITATGPRFGFTVTKALGGAVVRNRIRRRLRAAITDIVAAGHARDMHDYVIIARSAALDRPFVDLKKDLEQALQRVHHPERPKRRGKDS